MSSPNVSVALAVVTTSSSPEPFFIHSMKQNIYHGIDKSQLTTNVSYQNSLLSICH